MTKPFNGKILHTRVHHHAFTTHDILKIILKPVGLRKLNPYAWWRWFRIRSYADHARPMKPIIYMEDWQIKCEITEDGWIEVTEAGFYRPHKEE